MVPDELFARVSRALQPVGGVSAALVFGSQATGQARPDSDVDIAVLLDALPPPSEKKELLWSLVGALGKELGSDRVDLVLLNDAPPKLAFHVLKHGRVVLDRDPVQLHRFRVRTYSRHADYEPVERFFREATKRRARAARGHG
jgi:predicted nucleotidyltransferase